MLAGSLACCAVLRGTKVPYEYPCIVVLMHLAMLMIVVPLRAASAVVPTPKSIVTGLQVRTD